MSNSLSFVFVSGILFCYATIYSKSIEVNDFKKPKNISYQKISQKKTWLKLLHYKHGDSSIRSKDFFLAENGHLSSLNELKVTIKKLFIEKEIQLICRFRARYLWLAKQLQEDTSLLSKCTVFNRWSQSNNFKSVSLVFASGYFSNPASFFGHPMLKLNFASTNRLGLLSVGINYGALTPNKPNPLLYIFKGLFGGYSAAYTESYFYHTISSYSELELRDLWEYELKLSKWERDFLIAHIWELMRVKFPYYFIEDNCAYRIAELLELVIDKPLLHPSLPGAIPHDLIERVVNSGKVSKPKFIPSRLSEMKSYYESLDDFQKKIVGMIVERPKDLKIILNKVKRKHHIPILDTLIKYYSFRIIKDEKREDQKVRREFIRLRAEYSEKSSLPKLENKPFIHSAQPPRSWGLGLGYSGNNKMEVSLQGRGAYYDLLSPVLGSFSNSELLAVNYSFSYGEKLIVDYFDIFKIKTLNLSETGLDRDGGLAWTMQLSANSLENKSSTLNTFLMGGLGKGARLSHTTSIYGFLGGKVSSRGVVRGGSLGVLIGSTFSIMDNVRGGLEHIAFKSLSTDETEVETVLKLRLFSKKYKDYEFSISKRDFYNLNFKMNFYL